MLRAPQDELGLVPYRKKGVLLRHGSASRQARFGRELLEALNETGLSGVHRSLFDLQRGADRVSAHLFYVEHFQ